VLALAAIGAIALIGAFVAGATWRRGMDERQSVKEYHSTLETLRHVSDRVEPQTKAAKARRRVSAAANGSASTAAAASPSPPGRRAAARKTKAGATVAPDKVVAGLVRNQHVAGSTDHVTVPDAAHEPGAPARRHRDRGGAGAVATTGASTGAALGAAEGNGESTPDPGPPTLVFDDGAPAASFTPDPDSRRAIERMGHGRAGGGRRRGAVVAATVAVVAVIGIGVGIALAATNARSTPTPTATATPATHPTTKPSSASQRGTTTSVPATVLASSATAYTATYAAPPGAFTVVLDASGTCWVMATDLTSGRVLWTGTMAAGQSQSLAANGPVRVELGAASDMSMTLQGKPVVLPSSFQSPFTATFTPGG
jgi:hypothetical protein